MNVQELSNLLQGIAARCPDAVVKINGSDVINASLLLDDYPTVEIVVDGGIYEAYQELQEEYDDLLDADLRRRKKIEKLTEDIADLKADILYLEAKIAGADEVNTY